MPPNAGVNLRTSQIRARAQSSQSLDRSSGSTMLGRLASTPSGRDFLPRESHGSESGGNTLLDGCKFGGSKVTTEPFQVTRMLLNRRLVYIGIVHPHF